MLWMGVLLLWAGGCGPKPAPPPAWPDSTLQVSLQLPPGPIRQLDPTPLTVRLRDERNRPIDGAQVIIDLSMPDMDMGKNQVVATPQDGGIYSGKGRFTMAGEWQAAVTVSRAGRRTTQSFPVHVE